MIYVCNQTFGGFANRLAAWECAYSICLETGLRQQPLIDWTETRYITFPQTSIGPKPKDAKPFSTKAHGDLSEGDWYMDDGWDFTRQYQSEYEPGKRPVCGISLRDIDLEIRIRHAVKDCIGVHVRRGDYQSLPKNQFPTQAPHRVPDEWYEDVCKRLGGRFYMSSNGTDAELDILKRRIKPLMFRNIEPNAKRGDHYNLGLADVIDFFALASCRAVVCSISTWSMFAAVWRNIPYIWPTAMGQELPVL